jgi:hypothetical protein
MRKRMHQIKVYLDDTELESLQNRLKVSNLSQSEFLRQCIAENPIVVLDGIETLIREMKYIGNNVNQLARAANSRTPIDPEQLTAIQKELREIWQSLRSAKAVKV